MSTLLSIQQLNQQTPSTQWTRSRRRTLLVSSTLCANQVDARKERGFSPPNQRSVAKPSLLLPTSADICTLLKRSYSMPIIATYITNNPNVTVPSAETLLPHFSRIQKVCISTASLGRLMDSCPVSVVIPPFSKRWSSIAIPITHNTALKMTKTKTKTTRRCGEGHLGSQQCSRMLLASHSSGCPTSHFPIASSNYIASPTSSYHAHTFGPVITSLLWRPIPRSRL